MIWEDYGKVRENLDDYVEKVTDGSGEIVIGDRGRNADIVIMSRGHYSMMEAQLKELRRVKKVLDALEEYISYRKEVREQTEKNAQSVSKRIGAGVGLFEIPDDFFDGDFEPGEEPQNDQTASGKKEQTVSSKKEQAVSGKAEALRVAV